MLYVCLAILFFLALIVPVCAMRQQKTKKEQFYDDLDQIECIKKWKEKKKG